MGVGGVTRPGAGLYNGGSRAGRASAGRTGLTEHGYGERHYRQLVRRQGKFVFEVKVQETDLLITADQDLTTEAWDAACQARDRIQEYAEAHPGFYESLAPLPADPEAHQIVRQMLEAGEAVGVGPMAAVAGAVAESVGRALLRYTNEIVVENGGDIFLCGMAEASVGIYAGASPLSEKVGLRVRVPEGGLGVCCSSGTVGPSLSFGHADAAVVVGMPAALADAAATAVGNLLKGKEDVEAALERGMGIEGVRGIVVIIGDTLGAKGDLELFRA